MLAHTLFALASALAYANAKTFSYVKLDADVAGHAWITEAKATLTLPEVPEDVKDDVTIYSGVNMADNTTTLRGISTRSPTGSLCNSTEKPWCNFAQTLGGWNNTYGQGVTASPGSTIQIHHYLDPWTNNWKQEIFVDGEMVTNRTSFHSGKGERFFLGAECVSCDKMPAHDWDDIFVGLNQADEQFLHQGPLGEGAEGGNMSTRDGGMTWNLTRVDIL